MFRSTRLKLIAFEEEMFEDDAPEYVRRDLESASAFCYFLWSLSITKLYRALLTIALLLFGIHSDSETRRQAASDFTRALMEQFESQVTAIITRYIAAYLQVSMPHLSVVFRHSSVDAVLSS